MYHNMSINQSLIFSVSLYSKTEGAEGSCWAGRWSHRQSRALIEAAWPTLVRKPRYLQGPRPRRAAPRRAAQDRAPRLGREHASGASSCPSEPRTRGNRAAQRDDSEGDSEDVGTCSRLHPTCLRKGPRANLRNAPEKNFPIPSDMKLHRPFERAGAAARASALVRRPGKRSQRSGAYSVAPWSAQ